MRFDRVRARWPQSGQHHFFPRAGLAEESELLSGFLAQYYLGREAPGEILISQPIEDADLLEATLSERLERSVRIRSGVRGVRARWLEMARTNAEIGLNMRRATEATTTEQLQAVAEVFGLSTPPKRMECFDVSHTMGERTVASCVVFGPEGPLKSDYRRFNIEGLAPGDDYGALRQALSRRYARIKKGEAPLPDLLLIDGGPGQLAEAISVLKEFEIEGVCIAGVAKGADRRPGQERLFLAGEEQAPGAVATVRRAARCGARRHRRFGEGTWHRPQAGAVDLRHFARDGLKFHTIRSSEFSDCELADRGADRDDPAGRHPVLRTVSVGRTSLREHVHPCGCHRFVGRLPGAPPGPN